MILDALELESWFEHLIILCALDILMSCRRVRKATRVVPTMKVIKLIKPMIDLLNHLLLIQITMIAALEHFSIPHHHKLSILAHLDR